MRFRKKHTKVGARPGTLVIPKDAPQPKISSIHYSETEHRTSAVDSIDDLASSLCDGEVTWIDIQGFGDRTIMRKVGTMFNLHPLLLEDVVNVPQREAINELVRGDHQIISEEVGVYLRDTYDHCIQTSEVAEMYREMVTGLMNTYLSSVANRTNEVMKVLTIMASIFISLTFMAGIYGMNFEHMPELKYEYSYTILWIAMGVVASGMLLFFWRKGWIFERRR
ncbi:MAG: hypothetical protein KDB00_12645 [Planctomycetales bacterium]|nr:hypothetical protein [Planctomycetales bacterium]